MAKPLILSRSVRASLAGAFLVAASFFASASFSFAQGRNAPVKTTGDSLASVKSSPAFAELQLKKTELVSELEALILDYTEEFPKVKEIRFIVILIDRDIGKISKVKPNESSKLTLALGKLMVRRIELETDVWHLQLTHKDEHPDVKRAKRKVEIYDAAINDILN
jgi:hypothetical protein